jgi:hypothetical protein
MFGSYDNIKITVLWGVSTCSPIDKYRSLEEPALSSISAVEGDHVMVSHRRRVISVCRAHYAVLW